MLWHKGGRLRDGYRNKRPHNPEENASAKLEATLRVWRETRKESENHERTHSRSYQSSEARGVRKVVLDTSVLVSAFFFEGNERRVLEAAIRGEIRSVTSLDIME